VGGLADSGWRRGAAMPARHHQDPHRGGDQAGNAEHGELRDAAGVGGDGAEQLQPDGVRGKSKQEHRGHLGVMGDRRRGVGDAQRVFPVGRGAEDRADQLCDDIGDDGCECHAQPEERHPVQRRAGHPDRDERDGPALQLGADPSP